MQGTGIVSSVLCRSWKLMLAIAVGITQSNLLSLGRAEMALVNYTASSKALARSHSASTSSNPAVLSKLDGAMLLTTINSF